LEALQRAALGPRFRINESLKTLQQSGMLGQTARLGEALKQSGVLG
jgi:hypothetical protein